MNQIALALYYTGEYEAAVDAANRAIRPFPNYPNPYRWLAAALGQIGWIDEAGEVLKQAIAIAPAAFDLFVETVPLGYGQKSTPALLKGYARPGCRRSEALGSASAAATLGRGSPGKERLAGCSLRPFSGLFSPISEGFRASFRGARTGAIPHSAAARTRRTKCP